MRTKLSLAFLAPFLVGALAFAQISRTAPTPQIMQSAHGMPSAADTEAAKEWQRRLHKTDNQLRAGEWSKARREAGRLLSEMLFGIEIDPETAATLGLTLTFRALAEAGGGDVEAGRWDWLAAQALQPDLNEVSLDPYGAGGKPLELFRRDDHGELSAAAVRAIGVPPAVPIGEQVAPKKISGGEPRYPKALRATCAKGTARIAVTVDATGRPIHPRWLDASGGPAMALALFEAVRDWRWQPALRAGQAVPADVEIGHEFDPGHCRPRDE
ncbi:MAG TPA: TonB family protein [Thermoanaerobaculia bacterium]|jgi:TonB family protein|nr:TonB family protein [Thermoanaerobaculia bacterium]